MDAELRVRAEARLAEAATSLALADPRPPYRERLKQLRESHPDAFSRAVEHYETRVLPALAEKDALTAWLDYGRFLAGLTASGRLLAIDERGAAQPAKAPLPPRPLVLFLPEDPAEPVLVALQPVQLSPAQAATLDLLVNRRLGLS